MDQPSATFRPEVLLAHREWIERTARALVHGDAEAEDVAQQAWLEILQSPPTSGPERPRGWLRSVLRFTALDRMRSERRRRRHETGAARPETVDASPSDIVARAETLDRVVHLVLELEEPFRTTVLLRYFEDLPPAAIAARQGIPVETVRSRLRRAVARLRERLDAGTGGNRRRWCLALLPLLRRPSSGTAATAGTAASAAAGVLLMGIKTKVAVAAGLLLALGGGIVFVRPLESVDRGVPTLPRIPVVPVDEEAVRSPGEALPPPRSPSFAARVEDMSGKPLPGARVEVRMARDGKFAAWSGDRVLAFGSTDAAGTIALELPPEALARGREVRASRPGFTTATVRTNETEVVLRLAQAAVLKGRVFEAATGRGLEGVTLRAVWGRAWPREVVSSAVSGSDGSFSMDDLLPGTVTLQARPSSWLEAELPDLRVELGTPKFVEVPLQPGVRMEGKVLDADTGAPVCGGRLLVPGQPGYTADKVAALDAAGRFVLAGLPAWSGANPMDFFILDAAGYDRSPRTETKAAYDMEGKQTRDAVLRARPEPWWGVRVLDPEGRGVSGARVAIGTLTMLGELAQLDSQGKEYEGNARWRLRETVTDADGRCRLPSGWLQRAQGNNSWEQRILVLHPDFAPHYESVGPAHWSAPGEIRLEPGVRLVVEVADFSGRPEPGAEVRTALRDPFKDHPFVGDVFGSFEGPGLTDASGLTTLSHICAGEWQVRVWSADGLRRAANTVQVDGTGPVSCRVTLEDSPPVLGTVVDADTGLPLPGAVVRLQSGVQGEPRKAVADAQGRFEFRFAEKEPLLPGFVLLVAEVPAPGIWAPSGRVDDAQAGVPVTLRARCAIRQVQDVSIRVLDATTGAPVSKGFIGFHWKDPRDPGSTQNGSLPFVSGRYSSWMPVVDGLRISLAAPGCEPINLTPDELESFQYEVRLVPKGAQEEVAAKYRLRVKVVGGQHPAGRDIPSSALVYLYDPETKQPYKRRGMGMELTSMGTLPEFVITEHELPSPGRVLLELQVYGWYMAAPVECTIEAGKETEVCVDLIQGGGSLVGKAEAESGSRITLTYPSGQVRKLWVGDEGKFYSGSLAPGTYTLALEGGQPVTATVVNGVKTEVNLRK